MTAGLLGVVGFPVALVVFLFPPGLTLAAVELADGDLQCLRVPERAWIRYRRTAVSAATAAYGEG